ncbi:putative secreted protein (Por secretion system target) [Mariniflexile fucanivorans]|uniref:Putative secreted protein (Por secretion system target) n=1 Tax=Mariniflexile fucanivorans TaxID=264023 RepID=A0A4R1RJS0_9FLAO|nr:leucine-rich repeat domain-containing protein [Mariniflexile fucanivorans]TCL66256.1 putative secreted protein (Por secretion system target) [Mariniflexile fucanivorans]
MVTTTLSAQTVGDVFTDGDYSYEVTSVAPNEAAVTGSTLTADIVIPDTATDAATTTTYNVTSIGGSAFESSSITTVVLSSNVVRLEIKAFAACAALTSIEGTSNVTYIGNYCFNNCKALTKLEFPSLIEIGTGAIYNSVIGPGGISRFNIPSSVTTIRNILLGRLQNLTAVQVNWQDPATEVTVDPANFFRNIAIGTEGTVKLYVPSGKKSTYETTAPWNLFHVNNIIEGTMPPEPLDPVGTLFTIDDIEYRVTSVDNLQVEVASSTLTAITVPPTVTKLDGDANTYSVTAIGNGAFLDNTTVTSVALPTSVTVLKGDAFSGAVNLETINLENIVTIETQNVFFNCPKLTTANLAAATSIGNFAFHGLANSTLSSISIPSMVTIGGSAFRTSVIPSIDIPATVTSIGNNAFQDCTSLTGIQVNWDTAGAIPVIDTSVFTNLTVSGITLYVPTGSSALYQAADVWKDFTIVEGTLSTNNLEQELGFSIYPNPTNSIVSIKSKQLNNASVGVYDLNGRALLSQTISGTSSEVNISNLASGIYLFKVQVEDAAFTKRIVKQ